MGKILQYQSKMPEPTVENPYAQIEWIFRDKMMLYQTKSTQSNYRSACSFYINFLRETNNFNPNLTSDPRFYLKSNWDLMALVKLETWIQINNIKGEENYLSSNTIVSLLSAVRQTMEHAYEHGYIDKSVFNVPASKAVRETDSRTAYTDEEYTAIFRAINPLIKFSKNLLLPYKITGKGQDPRILNRRGVPAGQRSYGQGWLAPPESETNNSQEAQCIETKNNDSISCDDSNLRWYFENEMNCIPLIGTRENLVKHKSFFTAASNFFGGLNKVYRKWGVSAFIDHDVIMPLVVELIAETGLNVESVLSLRRDCFVAAHPLTGLPFLQYHKPRSCGDKELPLSLYDQKNHALGLGQKQSQIIARTINTILKLTEKAAAKAKDDIKDFLLIYEGTSNTGLGEIQRISTKTIYLWTKKIVEENDLHGRDGKPLTFNLSRFRPTKFTQMVKDGTDIFHIMAIAGHASITTTFLYIDALQTTGDFHRTVSNALNNIKNNKRQQERRQLPIATQNGAQPGKFIFKGSFCNCKNPYDPPEQVKNSRSYQKGEACTNWNMCLMCENVLISELNLPKLFAYRSEISRALANGVRDMPRQGELYKKMASVLDQILKPDVMFSSEALEQAANRAEMEDYESIDGFVY